MPKKLKHDNLSDTVCSEPGCTKRIKQRLIDSSLRFTKCYFHHCQDEAKRDHDINSKPREKRVLAGLPVKTFGGAT